MIRRNARAPQALAPLEDWMGFLAACRERVLAHGGRGHDQHRTAVAAAADQLLTESQIRGAAHEAMTAAAIAELAGAGILEPLLARPEISEIMVRGTERIWIEADGRMERTDLCFSDVGSLRAVIARLLMGSGRRVDEASPIVDACLEDGSRINVVLPPVAPVPTLTVRRFTGRRFGMDALIDGGMVTPTMASFLHAAVMGRATLVVSGATGSGKTTLLGALAGLVPADERIVVVEDVPELAIDHPNVATQQCRPGGTDGVVEVDLRRLVRNSLRMRPDRIIVGEVRGAESVEMLQAMNTGHAGSMTTLHANSTDDVLLRLETLLAQGLPGLSGDVVRRWIGTTIDIIVHCERGRDGVRRIADIGAVEVVGDGVAVMPVLRRSADPAVVLTSGSVPLRCLHRMADHGVVFPQELLRENAA